MPYIFRAEIQGLFCAHFPGSNGFPAFQIWPAAGFDFPEAASSARGEVENSEAFAARILGPVFSASGALVSRKMRIFE